MPPPFSAALEARGPRCVDPCPHPCDFVTPRHRNPLVYDDGVVRVAAVGGLLLVAVACDDPPARPADGGAGDASDDAGSDAAPGIEPPRRPEPPRLSPCPEGWREVRTVAAFAECEPWPEGGRHTCPEGQAHLPGASGCEPLGAACPMGEYPEDLPAGSPVWFVRAGASGGDGTRELPFGTIAEALAAAAAGDTIAIARGLYPEALQLERPVHLVGACAAETILEPAAESIRGGALVPTEAADGSSARDLTFRSARSAALFHRGGTLRLRGVVLTGSGFATAASILGGSLDAERVQLRSEDGTPLDAHGEGGVILRSAELLVEGAGSAGLRISGGDLSAQDVLLRGVSGDDPMALLVHCYGEATCAFDRAVLEDNGTALLLSDGAELLLSRVVLRGPGAPADPSLDGVVSIDSVLRVEATRIEALAGGGILAGGTGSAHLSDLVVRDTGLLARAQAGRGIEIELAEAHLARVHIERSVQVGLIVTGGGTRVSAEDVSIRDVASDALGSWGRCLQVQLGAVLEASRLEALSCREIGVMASEPGTEATLTDLAVSDTQPRACAESTCAGFGAGIGLGSYRGARLRVDRFVSTGNTLVGVQVARDGELDLAEGEVAENPIGANVQVPGYDLTRLSRRVLYRRNGTNLDAEELPVPDP